ncbi:MAG TPA: PDZ domain-containing protein [Kofleriaceae bacterium]|nr:PDZ domain-containing protein [Kofleriaceae bacterium]
MIRAAALASLMLALSSTARADVEYQLDLGEREAHRATVEMIVRGAPSPLELAMPVWTPGAYEVRTWGRNVTLLGAADGAGRALSARRTGASTFRVEGHAAGSEVRVRYRVFAAVLSDDGSQIDNNHAYLNGTSIFLQARGQERARHRVAPGVPAGWRAASALDETPSGGFEAFGYEALVDAPIELGRFAIAEVRAAGRSYRVAVDGLPEVPPMLLRDVAALAEAEARMVGAPPYARYLLLIHLADGIGRLAALEHAASASIIVPHRSLQSGASEHYEELLYVVAHELFHAWNARRLRPAELVPYDLSRPTPSRSLWITEGLTEYYAHRAMHLAGRWSRARYLERLGDESTRAVNAARRGLTLEDEAELAFQPSDEAAADPDAYYARGHLVALALDASIRAATDGKRTLDDAVKALLAEADRAGGIVAVDGAVLAKEIARLAGDATAERVAAWTRSADEPPRMAEALSGLGLKLAIEEGPARTVAGFAADSDGGSLRVAAVSPNGPAAHAGLRTGDRIVLIDGVAPSRKWAETLAGRSPGAAVALEAVRATRRLLLELRLEARRAVSCRVSETPAPPKVALRRDAWLAR